MRAKVRPIVPRKPMADGKAVQAAIESAMDRVAAETKEDYQKTTRTWTTPVTFTIRKLKNGRSVGTTSKIYGYVDQGTRPHIITPKAPGYPLRFSTGGRPKSRIRVIGASGGAPGTNPAVGYVVHHPGTEARQFTQVLNTRARQKMARYSNEELKKVYKR